MKKVLFGMGLFAVSAAANAIQVYLVHEKGTANGTTITTQITDGSHTNHSTATTATFDWDGTTLSSTGVYSSVGAIGSNPILASILADIVTDLSVDTSTLTASATAFVCEEGNFLMGVGASGCGGYNFGGNGANETTTTWGPGTAVAQTPGGDDNINTGPRTISSAYDGVALVSWDGTTLVLGNTIPLGTIGANEWVFTTINPAIPVPAAAWLFGSALGLLGWARRRAAK
jgi:hypothetical protein